MSRVVADYVIVGSGVGSIVASRLASVGHSVLLLEAGPRDSSPLVHIPLLSLATSVSFSRKLNWRFYSDPEPWLDGRQIYQPRGKILGGSSSINGMICVRGHPRDYDHWGKGWTYKDLLPYFRKSEDFEEGEDEFHGTGGGYAVSLPRYVHPISRACIEAACNVTGLPPNKDFMAGDKLEGFGPYHMNQKKGARWSLARGYLGLRDDQLKVVTGATVEKLEWSGPGRLGGVVFKEGGQEKVAMANKEVILSAGVFGSPQLLMLSGIGPVDALHEIGVPIGHHLPGVGRNLVDHLDANVVFNNPSGEAFGLSWRAWPMLATAPFMYLVGRGAWTSNCVDSGGFVEVGGKQEGGRQYPNVQYHFFPGSFRDYSLKGFLNHTFALHVYLSRPRSRGRLTLIDRNPDTPPRLRFNYLENPEDRNTLVAGLRLAREIAMDKGLDKFRGEELHPGVTVQSDSEWEEYLRATARSDDHPMGTPGPQLGNDADIYYLGVTVQSDSEWEEYLRATARSAHHPVGTCRMGEDDMAVVDGDLKVHGLEGIRVVDASIFPSHITANPHATAIAIAEKASNVILGDGGKEDERWTQGALGLGEIRI